MRAMLNIPITQDVDKFLQGVSCELQHRSNSMPSTGYLLSFVSLFHFLSVVSIDFHRTTPLRPQAYLVDSASHHHHRQNCYLHGLSTPATPNCLYFSPLPPLPIFRASCIITIYLVYSFPPPIALTTRGSISFLLSLFFLPSLSSSDLHILIPATRNFLLLLYPHVTLPSSLAAASDHISWGFLSLSPPPLLQHHKQAGVVNNLTNVVRILREPRLFFRQTAAFPSS